MKKLNLLLVLALSTTLFSCGGGEGGSGATSNTTVDFKSNGTFLKDFEKKSAAAYMGGIVWNGKKRAQTMEIGISNAEVMKISKYGMFTTPEKENEVIIGLKLSGKLFEKGAEPVLIKKGDVFTTGADDYVLSCAVYLPDMKMTKFNGETYSPIKDFDGTATISNITADLVEGTIDFKTVDGTSSISVKFSEPYTDNWTGKGFDK